MRLLLVIASFVATTASAQTGQILGCVQGPVGVATIVISPSLPGAGEPVVISVSPGDHSSFPNVVVADSVAAVVNGQIINVTVHGFIFSPAPSHINGTCGVVTVAGLSAGVYTVNFFLDVHSPGPPSLAASATLDIAEAANPIPVTRPSTIAILTLAILLVALARLVNPATHRA